VAHFKLADTLYRQTNFSGAAAQYKLVVEQCGRPALLGASTNLCEPALYQWVRSSLAANDMASASNALAQLLSAYPLGFHADQAILLLGQDRSNNGNPAGARKLFEGYLKSAPESPLKGEVQLAVARTYEREGAWTNAVRQYNTWLAENTNNPAVPRAEYSRAIALWQSRDETNAFVQFTNFVARFPTNELALPSQLWVADYYYEHGNPVEAERNYELLSHRSNSGETPYQSLMMAGRAAIKRQSWNDASDYFTKLASNTNCPEDIRAQALFAYGDLLIARDGVTNKINDFKQAMAVFSRIGELFPSNRLAVLALGEKADCLIQWAQLTHEPGSLTNALESFQAVVSSTNAGIRSQSAARVGKSVVLEKIASGKSGPERAVLLQAALNECLDVIYSADENSDPFWTKRAGLQASALAETLGQPAQVASVYRRLELLLPPMRPWLEKQIARLEGRTLTVERTGP
jgi:TolA-binding protein